MADPRPPMNFPDWSSFGPKMRALTELQRKFVWAYLLNAMTDGRRNGAQAARDAGYSDHMDRCKVSAHINLHTDAVLDAMSEVAGQQLRGLAVPAMVSLGRLLDKPDHPDHRKAVEMVLDRTGFAPQQTINVHKTVTDQSGQAIMERIRALAEKHGLDAGQLLGKPVKVIEHEP